MSTSTAGSTAEMASRIRAFDWGRTPLGPREDWGPALRTSVEIALASRFPMILWWGSELIVLYNDAYVPIFAAKHPGALGAPGLSPAAWGDPEVRRVIEPMLRGVLEKGEATWSEDQLLVLERHGFPEETYFTWSYSPVREGDEVVGVFSAVSETTGTVIRARRLRLLSELTAATIESPSVEEVCRRAAGVLAQYGSDVPFHLIYLLHPEGPRLAGGAGDALGSVSGSHVGAMMRALDAGERLLDLPDLSWSVGSVWPEPVTRATVLPLAGAGEQRRVGFITLGLSPRVVHDSDYSDFLELLASRIASAIGDATALEEERRRAQALAELDRSKSVFFSNVSHEFRTPLTLMLGPLEEALRQGPGAEWEAQRDRLETARGNGLRLLKLVNSLLDFSRLEAGRAPVAPSSTDLGSLTEDLVSVFRSAYGAAGIDLRVDIGPMESPVDLDVEMWETVVFNLLSNALKYTQRGSVVVQLRQEASSVVLRVSDTGVGIAPEETAHVFERFYRSEAAAGRSLEGTGIGLALVRELLTLQGGTIEVESALGRGSTFTVKVPLVRSAGPRKEDLQWSSARVMRAESFLEEARRWMPDAEASLELTVPNPRGGAAPSPPAQDTILVVDDNSDMRRYVRSLLIDSYRVIIAADGEEALRLAREHRPAAVVSDVMMPVMDGLELLRRLRDDDDLRTTPVLLLSARAGAEAALGGLEAGADEYLVKPFSGRELRTRLGALIATTRRRELASAREEDRRQLQAVLASLAGSLNSARDVDDVAGCLGRAVEPLDALASLSVLDRRGVLATLYTASLAVPVPLRTRYRRFSLDADVPDARAMRLGEPLLYGRQADIETEFPAVARDLRPLGIRSFVSWPLISADGRVFGAMSIGWRDEVEFHTDRVQQLGELAETLARAVERVLAYDLERQVAHEFQRGLLALSRRVPNSVVRTYYRSSDATLEVGGDWYDVVDLDGRRLAVTVGDVVGRGLSAATVMAQLRSALAGAAMRGGDPAAVVDHVDRYARHLPGAECATALFALIDTAAEQLAYFRAGHPPGVLVTPDGTLCLLDGGVSWPLSVRTDVTRGAAATAAFPAGSLLLLYTDGLIEHRGATIEDGLARLCTVVGRYWNLPQRELERRILDELVGAGSPRDDIAVVAVRTIVSNPSLFADAFPAAPLEARAARHRFVDWLKQVAAPEEVRYGMELAVGELLANAVEHGSAYSAELSIGMEAARTDDEVYVAVSDSGTWQSGFEGAASGRGFGYTLIEELVDDVDISSDYQGTVVTLRRRLHTVDMADG